MPQKNSLDRTVSVLGRIVLMALIVPGLYVGFQVYQAFHPSYSYETTILYTMSDAVQCDGVVVFEETFVDGGGALGYLVGDGERVSAGTAVAEVYTSDEQPALRAELTALDGQLALLEKSQNTASTQLGVLMTRRATALYDLLDAVDRGTYSDVQAQKENYLLAQNKIQITTGEAEGFDALIRQLTAERADAAARLGSPQTIAAPSGGYFISSRSARVLNAPREDIFAMTPADFAAWLNAGADAEQFSGAGKIVSSYTWYFVGSCNTAQALKFVDKDGQPLSRVTLSFPGEAETELPAQVVSIDTDAENDTAKFVLKCEYMGGDVLRLGQAAAQITFKTYTGLRVSKKAIRLVKEEPTASSSASDAASEAAQPVQEQGENYVEGVYVKYGNLAKFRPIERVFENEEYCLVSTEGVENASGKLKLYDEIILEGQNLKDGKLL